MDNLDSAEGYPDSKAQEIRSLRQQVFIAIQNQRKDAIKAKEEAEKQKIRADDAREKVEAVIDLIYF